MPSRKDKLKPLKDYLEKEGKASVKEMRGWLSSWSIDGGKLAKSIKSKVIKKNNFFEISYELEDYFDYVDSGVNGKKKNAYAKKNRFGKFYKFRNESPSRAHVKAIEKWGKNKGIPKEASYPIAKSIKQKGLQAKTFYKITLNRRRKNMERQIENIIFDILNK